MIMSLSGRQREECRLALEAANWEPNLAFEFLSTGIPSNPIQTENFRNQPEATADIIEAYVNNPKFAVMR
jgi:hypothetical protein